MQICEDDAQNFVFAEQLVLQFFHIVLFSDVVLKNYAVELHRNHRAGHLLAGRLSTRDHVPPETTGSRGWLQATKTNNSLGWHLSAPGTTKSVNLCSNRHSLVLVDDVYGQSMAWRPVGAWVKPSEVSGRVPMISIWLLSLLLVNYFCKGQNQSGITVFIAFQDT
jgi:hypothetical protein